MKRLLVTAISISALFVVASPQGASASTLFLNEAFGASWTPGTDWITATGSSYTPQIVTDANQTPNSALRLTPATTSQNSAIIYADPQPTSQGLDVSFRQSQWGGSTGADGISFFLQKGSETSTAAGSLGGALGYSAEFGAQRPGLPGGLIGIGLDRFGNFPVPIFGGSGCSDNDPGLTPNNLTIRGPGNGTVGYCRLASVSNITATNWSTGDTTRAGGARSVRITIDPSTVSTPKVKVWVCAAAARCDISTTPTLSVDAPAQLLAEPTVRFGFAAGTGSFTNNHEIWDLQVGSINTFPAVAISTTSLAGGTEGVAYNQTVAATGVAPITYSIASGTLPAGLTLDPATGVISGTPTTAGSSAFTIRASDNRATGQSGRTADQAFTIVVSSAPTTTSAPTSTAAPSTTTTTVATPSVTPPSNQTIKNLPSEDIVSDETVSPGQRLRVDAEGFAPTETVVVGIAGSKTPLTTVVADANGEITTRVTLPDSVRGEITIYAFGQTSKRGLKETITVTLPDTGADSTATRDIALLLITLGSLASIVALRRRRLT